MDLQILVKTPRGDKMLVSSMDGHEDCIVLEKNVVAPRVAGCRRVNKRWKIHSKKKTKRMALASVSQEKLVDYILKLEERVAALETENSKAKDKK